MTSSDDRSRLATLRGSSPGVPKSKEVSRSQLSGRADTPSRSPSFGSADTEGRRCRRHEETRCPSRDALFGVRSLWARRPDDVLLRSLSPSLSDPSLLAVRLILGAEAENVGALSVSASSARDLLVASCFLGVRVTRFPSEGELADSVNAGTFCTWGPARVDLLRVAMGVLKLSMAVGRNAADADAVSFVGPLSD